MKPLLAVLVSMSLGFAVLDGLSSPAAEPPKPATWPVVIPAGQSVEYPARTSTPDSAAPAAARPLQFRAALLAAAQDAHRDGKLTRWQLAKIRLASLNPKIAAELQDCVTDEAVSAGLIPEAAAAEAGSFDWSKLKELILKLLPLILDILL